MVFSHPSEKICSSNWIISKWGENKKYLSCHHLDNHISLLIPYSCPFIDMRTSVKLYSVLNQVWWVYHRFRGFAKPTCQTCGKPYKWHAAGGAVLGGSLSETEKLPPSLTHLQKSSLYSNVTKLNSEVPDNFFWVRVLSLSFCARYAKQLIFRVNTPIPCSIQQFILITVICKPLIVFLDILQTWVRMRIGATKHIRFKKSYWTNLPPVETMETHVWCELLAWHPATL